MTLQEAWAIQSQMSAAQDLLVASFPCIECKGTGDLNNKNMPYRRMCEECWGRGYKIPDEEEE